MKLFEIDCLLEKVAKIWRRDLPTEAHRDAWKYFDKILMYRTNAVFACRLAYDILFLSIGMGRIQKSKEYIAEGKEYN